MSEGFRFVEPRVDFLDERTGKISRQWYLFLQGLYRRVGEAPGFGTDDIALSLPDDAGVEETKLDVYQLRDEVRALPPAEVHAQVQQLQTEVQELRDQLYELNKAVHALQQGTVL